MSQPPDYSHLEGQQLAGFMKEMSEAAVTESWGAPCKPTEDNNLTIGKLERAYRRLSSAGLSESEAVQLINTRNAQSETVWHSEAASKLRDLTVSSGIPLSTIARAAKGETYYKLRVSDRHIDEYRKWRAVYDTTRRILKGK